MKTVDDYRWSYAPNSPLLIRQACCVCGKDIPPGQPRLYTRSEKGFWIQRHHREPIRYRNDGQLLDDPTAEQREVVNRILSKLEGEARGDLAEILAMAMWLREENIRQEAR